MMKKLFLTTLFAAFFLCRFLGAEELPVPVGWVNDPAGVISSEYRAKLTSLIEELRQKTGAEIFVLAVSSIAGHDEKSYARRVFDSWKPGKKGKDNGVLLLLAVKERRWRIETGYGVEGILPDGRCGKIGRSYMVPYFKQGEYGRGLYNGAAVIANIIAKDANVALDASVPEDAYVPLNENIVFFVVFGIFLLFSIIPNLIRARSYYLKHGNYGGYWTSGGFGGGFGGGGFGGGGFGGGGAGGGF